MLRSGLHRSHISRGATAAVGVTFALLTLCVAGTGAAAPLAPAAASYSNTWSYGAIKTVSYDGLNASNIPYQATGTVGFSVVLSEATGPNSVVALHVTRIMGAAINVEYCYPSCRSPTAIGSVTYRAWEASEAFANFTTNGSVLEGTSTVPAVALLNSSASLVGELRLSTEYTDAGVVVRSRSLSVNVSGSDQISFLTPLGIFPTNLSAGTSWSSTAAFAAVGSSAWSLYYVRSGVASVSLTGSALVPTTGTVSVFGGYGIGSNISLGGESFAAINLTVVGPFAVREGFILVPDGSDLFGSSAQPFSGNETGATTALLSHLDVRPSLRTHLGIGGSDWVWAAASTDPASSLEQSQGIAPASSGADESPAIQVQGEPESSSAYGTTQSCLENGVSCPVGAGTSHPFVAALLGIGVVVVVIVVALVLVTERRRMPAPRYPNATLYPPGASGGRLAGPDGTTPPPNPPAEDDPLSHLW